MMHPTARASASLLALVCVALSMPACFGTGVSLADAAQAQELSGALVIGDATVTPPAPAQAALMWRNTSAHKVTVTQVTIADAAKTTVDAPDCAGYPALGPNATCAVRITAHHDATPGSYPVTVAYEVGQTRQSASFMLTIAEGSLRINDGAPVALDARSQAVPITVINDGFDLAALNLDVTCPNPRAQGSTCALEPNDCQHGLAANAKCTARLVTSDPAVGQLGAVTAGGSSTGAVSCSVAISVGSLGVKNLAVTAPGVHNVVLTNQGSVPLTVTDVAVVAASQTGFAVVGAAQQYAGCQAFTGTCSVPLTVSRSADLSDNLGVIAVSYTDGLANHRATGVLTLNNATQVVVYPGVTLDAAPADRTVAAKNLGPWMWHGAGLRLSPALANVSLFSDCATELDVGEEYTATARTTAYPTEGASASLQALGKNLMAPAAAPIAIARGMVVTGTDASGAGLLLSSTDEGISWRRQQPAQPQTTWLASVLTANAWVAVGTQSNAPVASVSFSRGAFWQAATLPAGLAGALTAVAEHDNILMAVGHDGAGHPLMLTSSDGGLSWTSVATNPGAPASGELYALTSSPTKWVAVGRNSTQTLIASTSNAGATWHVASANTGALKAVAWDGNYFVAVGQSSGTQLILSCNDAVAATGSWLDRSASPAATETLAGIASLNGAWLAVGQAASQRSFVSSNDPSVPDFIPSRAMGTGGYVGVTTHGQALLALGFGATSTTPIIDSTPDGVAITTQPLFPGVVVTSIASR